MELVPFLISYAIMRRRVENTASTFGRRPIWSLVIGLGLMGAATLLYVGADRLKRWSDYADWGITALLVIIFAIGYVGLSYWVGSKFLLEQVPFRRRWQAQWPCWYFNWSPSWDPSLLS